MSGTVIGGKLAAKRNKEKYGEDYYKNIGKLGGLAGNTGGFYNNPELARKWGKVGGTISRRGKKSIDKN